MLCDLQADSFLGTGSDILADVFTHVPKEQYLTLFSRVVNLIKYPLMPGLFKFFEFSTPKCTVTYILTL
jgi:hypothetical protein